MLLDKIFKVNEKERITIDGIREDPWYQGPLQKKFSEAEERINKQQHEVEERCRQRALNPVSASHRHPFLIQMSIGRFYVMLRWQA